MKKRNLAMGILAVLLASEAAQAAPGFCALAGHYRGSYAGAQDRGDVDATIDAGDGTLRGVAVSGVTGQKVALGGVVSPTGAYDFSAGVAGSGAQFSGLFAGAADGGVVGGGIWHLAAIDGGKWHVERDSVPEDCL